MSTPATAADASAVSTGRSYYYYGFIAAIIVLVVLVLVFLFLAGFGVVSWLVGGLMVGLSALILFVILAYYFYGSRITLFSSASKPALTRDCTDVTVTMDAQQICVPTQVCVNLPPIRQTQRQCRS
jgi:hypothetical protein